MQEPRRPSGDNPVDGQRGREARSLVETRCDEATSPFAFFYPIFILRDNLNLPIGTAPGLLQTYASDHNSIFRNYYFIFRFFFSSPVYLFLFFSVLSC